MSAPDDESEPNIAAQIAAGAAAFARQMMRDRKCRACGGPGGVYREDWDEYICAECRTEVPWNQPLPGLSVSAPDRGEALEHICGAAGGRSLYDPMCPACATAMQIRLAKEGTVRADQERAILKSGNDIYWAGYRDGQAHAAAAPPDSVRDTLAHALLGTPNVSVYGVGDDEENALTAADFMLREYDWPWPGAGGPAELEAQRVGQRKLLNRIQLLASNGPIDPQRALNEIVPLVSSALRVLDAADQSRGSVPGGSPTGEREP